MTSTQTKQGVLACSVPPAPLFRTLFLIAGVVILTGVVLSATVSTWFLLIPTLVGLNQLLMAAVGWCPMSLLLTKVGVQAR